MRVLLAERVSPIGSAIFLTIAFILSIISIIKNEKGYDIGIVITTLIPLLFGAGILAHNALGKEDRKWNIYIPVTILIVFSGISSTLSIKNTQEEENNETVDILILIFNIIALISSIYITYYYSKPTNLMLADQITPINTSAEGALAATLLPGTTQQTISSFGYKW